MGQGLFGTLASGLRGREVKTTGAVNLTWAALFGQNTARSGVSVNVDSALKVSTADNLVFSASTSAASSRPLLWSRSHCAATAEIDFVVTSDRVSKSRTVLPACAASCAMPLPMAPAPMTPTTGKTVFIAQIMLQASGTQFLRR